MKRILVMVAALLLPLSAMAGVTAFMSMDEANDQDLAQVTGQTGINIEIQNLDTDIGSAGWEDNDGFIAGGSTGAVILSGITMENLQLGVLSIDAGTTLATSYISIACPAGMSQGVINVQDIIVNNNVTNIVATTANSLGRVRLTSVETTFDRILISPHD